MFTKLLNRRFSKVRDGFGDLRTKVAQSECCCKHDARTVPAEDHVPLKEKILFRN